MCLYVWLKCVRACVRAVRVRACSIVYACTYVDKCEEASHEEAAAAERR